MTAASFAAKHAGQCRNCGAKIHIGALVCSLHGQIVHNQCPTGGDDYRWCPHCRIIHAGPCP